MSFTQKCVFFQYLPRTAEAYFFTKFMDIGGLSCWKACKNEVKGDVLCVRPCSVNASVASYAPF